MHPISLLDESLQIEVFFSIEDRDLEDNICLKIIECCPEEEKLFKHDESDLYLTRKQARAFAETLLTAAQKSEESSV